MKKMTSNKLTLSAALVLTLAAALGCNEAPQQGTADAGALKLSALAPTSARDADAVKMAIAPSEGGSTVTLTAGENMPNLSELFFQITYDETVSHVLGLQSATGGIGDGEVPQRLGLLVEPTPGTIDVGFAAVGANDSAIVAGDVLASFQLVNGASAPKSASQVADENSSRARNLTLNKNDEDNWVLAWDYTNPGDANQDGEVSINDLTPIGLHYQEVIKDDFEDPLRHIDGDLNGEINLGDLTPIGSNYSNEIWAYQIEMSENGLDDFLTVGQLVLDEQSGAAGETVRFSYTFGAQYVEGYWYRVVPLNRDLAFGAPSEAVSSAGRMIQIDDVEAGKKYTVTVGVKDLRGNMANMNSCRVVYPENFKYVKDSYNCGSPGGSRDAIDGIWSSFASSILFPPENFIVEQSLGDGSKCLDLNVTTIDRTVPASPAGYGDLFNIRLEATSSAPLVLLFQTTSSDGIERTYFSDAEGNDQQFEAALGFTVQ
jgi:hypothetical protein